MSLMAAALISELPPCAPVDVEDGTLSEQTVHFMEQSPDPILNKLGKAFLTPDLFDLLGQRLIQAVLNRRKYTLIQENCRAGYIVLPDDEFGYFCARLRTAEYDLASMREMCQKSPVKEVARIALLVFSFGAMMDTPMATSAYRFSFVTQLKDALMSTDMKGLLGQHVVLLTWVLFLGAHASKSRKERSWYMMHLARALNADGMHCEDIDDLRSLLEGFFYLDRSHGTSLKECWDETSLLKSSV